MMNKEECEKALEHLIECKQRKLCDKCNFKLRCTMSNDELVINQLIEECFEPKENTSEFKHFKLHSDSSLKNLTKVELIDYIKMLYNNWGVCDDQLKRVIDKAKELLEFVDIRCNDRYVYIATNNDEGVTFPKEDIESIEITKF